MYVPKFSSVTTWKCRTQQHSGHPPCSFPYPVTSIWLSVPMNLPTLGTSCKWVTSCLSFCDRLPSPSIRSWRLIGAVAGVRVSFLLQTLTTNHHAHTPHLVYPEDRHLGCSHLLATAHSAAVNVSVEVFVFVFSSSGYIPRNTTAAPYGNPVFNFLRNCQTVFQSCGTISHSHQWCKRVLVSLHSHQHIDHF